MTLPPCPPIIAWERVGLAFIGNVIAEEEMVESEQVVENVNNEREAHGQGDKVNL